MIEIAKDHLSDLCESRKMRLADALPDAPDNGSHITFASLTEVSECAARLKYPLSVLLEALVRDTAPEPAAVIARSGTGYKRTVQRGGRDYYTYEHLATATFAPELMALRLDVHCEDEADVVMNPGHAKTEINYVESGSVRYFWDEHDGGRHCSDLSAGDSILVSSQTPHSCMALEPNTRILSINF